LREPQQLAGNARTERANALGESLEESLALTAKRNASIRCRAGAAANIDEEVAARRAVAHFHYGRRGNDVCECLVECDCNAEGVVNV
jgi:hypothetical protein